MEPVDPEKSHWNEDNSRFFINYGRYFVPQRETQIEIIADLIPRFESDYHVIELAVGEGLLAEQILLRHPRCSVIGLDGSMEMIQRAQERLARFGERFQARQFDLFDYSWRDSTKPVHAIVSSLALHHLSAEEKIRLFEDVYKMLVSGGGFLIADMIEPVHALGWELAANNWDEVVRNRSKELDGNLKAFETFEREHWNTYRFFDPQDIDHPSPLFSQLKWLEAAGFIDIDVYWMLAGHTIYGGYKPIHLIDRAAMDTANRQSIGHSSR